MSSRLDRQLTIRSGRNDALHFSLTPEITSLGVVLYEHHTLGKDKTVGTGEVDIWQHISAAVPTADVEIPVRPPLPPRSCSAERKLTPAVNQVQEGGIVRLKLAFRPPGATSAPSSPVVTGTPLNSLPNGSRTSLAMASPSKSSRKSVSGDSPSTSWLFSRRKDKE